MMRRSCAALALLMTLSTISAANAESVAARRLRDGIAAYTQVEYDQALLHLGGALKQGASSEIAARAYYYLGCTYLALDRQAEAREAFETLLSFQPGYVPDRGSTSPKISALYTRVRRDYATPDGPPSMAHTPPASADRKLTKLEVQVLNLSPRLRPVLRYRSEASPGYFLVEAPTRGQRMSFVVPTPRGARTLLYYFELVDKNGVVLGRLSSARAPFEIAVARKRSRALAAGTPWYKTWWFWTLAGAAVATGVGVGVGVGLSGGDSRTTQVKILTDTGKPIF